MDPWIVVLLCVLAYLFLAGTLLPAVGGLLKRRRRELERGAR